MALLAGPPRTPTYFDVFCSFNLHLRSSFHFSILDHTLATFFGVLYTNIYFLTRKDMIALHSESRRRS